MSTLKRTTSSLLLVAALAAAGCGGGGSDYVQAPAPAPTPAPSPPPTGENYTNWFKVSVFAQQADGVPIVMDTLVFNFENDNPDAFSELIPAQSP